MPKGQLSGENEVLISSTEYLESPGRVRDHVRQGKIVKVVGDSGKLWLRVSRPKLSEEYLEFLRD